MADDVKKLREEIEELKRTQAVQNEALLTSARVTAEMFRYSTELVKEAKGESTATPSDFARWNKATIRQITRMEELIRKLGLDLKKDGLVPE